MQLADQNKENKFTERLYSLMRLVNPGIAEMEYMEFGYALEYITPANGWHSITPPSMSLIEEMVNSREFYESIQLRPKSGSKLILDDKVRGLTLELFAGLVEGMYEVDWINKHFYFDLRSFLFYHRTHYLDEKSIAHLGGEPYISFEPRQKQFLGSQGVGYKAFKEANLEVDTYFIDLINHLVDIMGTPILIAIAGQTAAGKTEIVERLKDSLISSKKNVTSIEMDNFFTDRDYREAKGIDSLGKEAFHFNLFKQCLADICQRKAILVSQYNTVDATSSHDLDGQLKPGRQPLEIQPADIIFMEGNFPFLFPEIAEMIKIKVMYLTDDPVRMQRKWKRDMDYRKKYGLMYFLNRYFREQFLMAESVYRPQLEHCDLFVDTTGATIWVNPVMRRLIHGN
jgi:uridine kinase